MSTFIPKSFIQYFDQLHPVPDFSDLMCPPTLGLKLNAVSMRLLSIAPGISVNAMTLAKVGGSIALSATLGAQNLTSRAFGREDEYSLDRAITVDTMSVAVEQLYNSTKEAFLPEKERQNLEFARNQNAQAEPMPQAKPPRRLSGGFFYLLFWPVKKVTVP